VAVVAVTKGGYKRVTDNPPKEPQAQSPDPKRVEQALAQIPADLTIPQFLRRDPEAPHWALLEIT
jgi:hypothetical protein